ncbi:hypothetical protein BX281_1384 [Streptomyces sp. Ag82_O1-15]|uniref:hypothetical protein n=1 Tax=Streptomyces sp. Ag82_O1-15 TaxID=1938855 RepID=UPI000BC6DF02|nr:hypothetical protein [Streptomyces sp. Ag82_O1-15]PBC93569.1 hypothetical protein BX281_1384 [Streptomyces sp. Ag82_O1-15]
MNTLDTTHLAGPIADRVAANNWTALTDELNEHGHALTTRLLTPDECHRVRALYDEPDRFRTTVGMARHSFGSGQYRYRDSFAVLLLSGRGCSESEGSDARSVADSCPAEPGSAHTSRFCCSVYCLTM